MLYIESIPSFDLAAALPLLSEERREKMLAVRNEAVRRQGIAAYLLLCRALKEEYGITEAPTFGYEAGGKPFLPEHPGIHFNLSHCKTAVACVLSDRPVGVDVETVRPFRESLARHVLSGEEYESVVTAERPKVEFIRLWTMKEACLKLTGEGIRTDLKTVLATPGVNIETTEEDGIVCSVAAYI